MRKFLFLVVLLVLIAVGWMQRDRVLALVGKKPVVEEREAPSAQLAEQAGSKLDRLASGQDSIAKFSATEIQSLLMYRFVQILPAFVDSPQVRLEDGKIKLNARVPVDQLPEMSGIGDAMAFLPDTAEVGLTGHLLSLESGRIGFAIDGVDAARLPLPDRLIPRALKRLGRKAEPGLPENALALPLPPGVASAQIIGDTLVLRRALHTPTGG